MSQLRRTYGSQGNRRRSQSNLQHQRWIDQQQQVRNQKKQKLHPKTQIFSIEENLDSPQTGRNLEFIRDFVMLSDRYQNDPEDFFEHFAYTENTFKKQLSRFITIHRINNDFPGKDNDEIIDYFFLHPYKLIYREGGFFENYLLRHTPDNASKYYKYEYSHKIQNEINSKKTVPLRKNESIWSPTEFTYDAQKFPIRADEMEKWYKVIMKKENPYDTRDIKKFIAPPEVANFAKSAFYGWISLVARTPGERRFSEYLFKTYKKRMFATEGDGKGISELFKKSPDEFQLEIAKRYRKEYGITLSGRPTNKCSGMRERKFLPQQKFMQAYFTPSNAKEIYGILGIHDVGTGKTCGAIGTLSFKWAPTGRWKILWVTRSELKNVPLEAIFEDMCSKVIQTMDKKSPEYQDLKKKIYNKNNWPDLFDKYIAPTWVGSKSEGKNPSFTSHVISYEQFYNLCKASGKDPNNPPEGSKGHVDRLNLRNANRDPLQNVFVVIDEGHNLYNDVDFAGFDSKKMMPVIENAIFYSHQKSKENACRLLVLTATPIISAKSPESLMKLLNLVRKPPVKDGKYRNLPTSNEAVNRTYPVGEIGLRKFKNDTKGLILYFEGNGQPDYFPIKHLWKTGYGNDIITSDSPYNEFIKCTLTPDQVRDIADALGEKNYLYAPEKKKVQKKKASPLEMYIPQKYYEMQYSQQGPGTRKQQDFSLPVFQARNVDQWQQQNYDLSSLDDDQEDQESSSGFGRTQNKKIRKRKNSNTGSVVKKLPIANTSRQTREIRTFANMGKLRNEEWFKPTFRKVWESKTIKYQNLMKAIEYVDAEDRRKDGHYYKHAIYTDLQNEYGLLALTLIFQLHGYRLVKIKQTQEEMSERDKNDPELRKIFKGKFKPAYELMLEDSRHYKGQVYKKGQVSARRAKNAFAVIGNIKSSSTPYKNASIGYFADKNDKFPSDAARKNILAKSVTSVYNSERNTMGRDVRFILIDSSYKEGLSLKNVRHYWKMEPPLSKSSEQQSSGRVTRFCGSKNMPFEAGKGWKVFIHQFYSVIGKDRHEQVVYDLELSKDAKKEASLVSRIQFYARQSAVDHELYKNVNSKRRIGNDRDPSKEIINFFGIP